jgi:Mrp family chromosome partitioning ATPase
MDPHSSENRVIVVTSGKGGVGKTTTTANLGMSIARCGQQAASGAVSRQSAPRRACQAPVGAHAAPAPRSALGRRCLVGGSHAPGRGRGQSAGPGLLLLRRCWLAGWLAVCSSACDACRLGYKVALIDADIGLRNLDLLLGLENRIL